MSRMEFNPSLEPTVGVEIELALVDSRTMALRSASQGLIARVPPQLEGTIKPELMQCYVEINSDVCMNLEEVEADLRVKLRALEAVADREGVRLFWSATHPFSTWRDQEITPNKRYAGLVDLLQDTARQLVTFGLHVHVGVDSGDKAVMICEFILRYMPLLLASSCNSPFWEGRNTGVCSWRSKIMDGLPTAGLPPLMRNWSEYVWLVNHLVETGYIETIREIWWDVRPHNKFGTVEIRICDIPGNFHDTLGLVALIQSLVKYLSDHIDHGAYQHDCHPMLIRQNKWRAARYGLDAQLVDSDTYELQPAREMVRRLVDQLKPTADDLDCVSYLERNLDLAARPNWAQRQVEILNRTGDARSVVREMTAASRLTSPA